MWLIKAHTSQEAPASTSGSSLPDVPDNAIAVGIPAKIIVKE